MSTEERIIAIERELERLDDHYDWLRRLSKRVSLLTDRTTALAVRTAPTQQMACDVPGPEEHSDKPFGLVACEGYWKSAGTVSMVKVSYKDCRVYWNDSAAAVEAVVRARLAADAQARVDAAVANAQIAAEARAKDLNEAIRRTNACAVAMERERDSLLLRINEMVAESARIAKSHGELETKLSGVQFNLNQALAESDKLRSRLAAAYTTNDNQASMIVKLEARNAKLEEFARWAVNSDKPIFIRELREKFIRELREKAEEALA